MRKGKGDDRRNETLKEKKDMRQGWMLKFFNFQSRANVSESKCEDTEPELDDGLKHRKGV